MVTDEPIFILFMIEEPIPINDFLFIVHVPAKATFGANETKSLRLQS